MIFVPVRTSTLKPDVHLTFEVYVKIQDRYVLYIRKGDDLRLQRLENLKKQKVRQMFIPAEQETDYQNFLDFNISYTHFWAIYFSFSLMRFSKNLQHVTMYFSTIKY